MFVAPIWKRRKLSILRRHPVWHWRCDLINNANSSTLDRLNRFCLIFLQAMVPNDCTVFKNWSNDGRIPNGKSVSRKTSTLKPFEECKRAFLYFAPSISPTSASECASLIELLLLHVPLNANYQVIISAKEVMFYPAFVCLLVCLSVSDFLQVKLLVQFSLQS